MINQANSKVKTNAGNNGLFCQIRTALWMMIIFDYGILFLALFTLKRQFFKFISWPTRWPTTGKSRTGRNGYESRFVRKLPRGKPTKGLESSDWRVWTLFVISRSRVQVTSPAPKHPENLGFRGVFLCVARWYAKSFRNKFKMNYYWQNITEVLYCGYTTIILCKKQ